MSVDEALAEAASRVRIARVSSGQRAQRVTGTSCQNTQGDNESNRYDCVSLSDCTVARTHIIFHLKVPLIMMKMRYFDWGLKGIVIHLDINGLYTVLRGKNQSENQTKHWYVW